MQKVLVRMLHFNSREERSLRAWKKQLPGFEDLRLYLLRREWIKYPWVLNDKECPRCAYRLRIVKAPLKTKSNGLLGRIFALFAYKCAFFELCAECDYGPEPIPAEDAYLYRINKSRIRRELERCYG